MTLNGQYDFNGRPVANVKFHFKGLKPKKIPDGLENESLEFSHGDEVEVVTRYVCVDVDHGTKADSVTGVLTDPIGREVEFQVVESNFRITRVLRWAEKEAVWEQAHGAVISS